MGHWWVGFHSVQTSGNASVPCSISLLELLQCKATPQRSPTAHTYTCSHLHMLTPTHTHTYTCSHLHMLIPTHSHTYTCPHLHMFTPTHSHTYTCLHLHISHLHMLTPTHAHIYTCSHLHVFTSTHAHVHPNILVLSLLPSPKRERGEKGLLSTVCAF